MDRVEKPIHRISVNLNVPLTFLRIKSNGSFLIVLYYQLSCVVQNDQEFGNCFSKRADNFSM